MHRRPFSLYNKGILIGMGALGIAPQDYRI